MRFFAVGQHAEGFIAIGQEATGVFALGQFATGFIAVGQVARGVIAIGQLSMGIFAVGQLALGLTFCVAMLGAGGRTLGIVLPIVPVPPRKKKLPELRGLAHVRDHGSGWMRGKLKRSGTQFTATLADGESVPVSVTTDLFLAAYGVAKNGTDLFLELTTGDRRSYRLRAMKNASDDTSGKPWITGLSFVQLGLLAVAAWGYWQFVIVDLIDFVQRLTQDFFLNGVTLT